ncbi:MAG: AAA family ATPase [Candidatus Eisenbacteria bacterium]
MSRRIRETAEARVLLRPLLAAGDDGPSMEERAHHLRIIRGDGTDGERTERIDRLLLGEISRLRSGLQRAEETQAQMKAFFEKVLAPPLHPAVFLRYVSDDRGRALVGCQSSRRVVGIPNEEEIGPLEIGDEVLLSNEQNAILARPGPGTLPPGETALFSRFASNGRLVLSCRGDEEVVVDRSAKLAPEELRTGDIVRYDRALWIAHEKIERSKGESYFLEETPAETFEDVGGLDEVIETLKRMLSFRKEHGEKALKYALRHRGSALLVGPPGNGKTLLVKALANWLAASSPSGRSLFMNVKPAGLHSMWYAQSEANYREVFRVAREAGAEDPDRPVVLFFDEIDAIGGSRSSGFARDVGDRVLTAFLTELDGLESRGNIVVVGATNRADLLDPALTRPGRMGDKPIRIPRPNRDAAREIFEKHLEPGIPYAGNGGDPAESRRRIIDAALARIFSPNGESDLAVLAFRDGSRRTARARDLINGAGIANIALASKEIACLREVESGEEGILLEDVLSAAADELDSLASYLTPRNCRDYLADLPQDLDVVSIEPVRRKVPRPHRYLNEC